MERGRTVRHFHSNIMVCCKYQCKSALENPLCSQQSCSCHKIVTLAAVAVVHMGLNSAVCIVLLYRQWHCHQKKGQPVPAWIVRERRDGCGRSQRV